MAEKNESIDALIERAKASGKLSTRELNDAFERFDLDAEQIDSFYETCINNNIEIVEDFMPDTDLKLGLDSDLSDDLEMALSTEGIAIDDPVKIYL